MKETNKVQVFATREAYRGSSVFVAPYFDETSMKFQIGDKMYEAIEAKNPNGDYKFRSDKNAPVLLTDALRIRITHNDSFDMSNPRDAAIVQMAIDRGVLARDLSEVNIGKADQVFYLKDDQREARETRERAKKVLDALRLLDKMQPTMKASLAYRYDAPVRTMNRDQVEAFLAELAMREPEKVIKTVEGNDTWIYEGWLTKAVHYGVLSVENGAYRLGSEIIGLDKAIAVTWLRDPRNAAVITQLKAKIKELRKHAQESSDLEEVETKEDVSEQ